MFISKHIFLIVLQQPAQRHKIKLKPHIYNFFTAALFSVRSFILFQVTFMLRIKLLIIKGITFIRVTAACYIL